MNTPTVRLNETVPDELLKTAVIAARFQGQWVFSRHRERTTLEFPGGHREEGESIEEAARRELFEETGALEFRLSPLCAFSVEGRTRLQPDGGKSWGMLFLAEIQRFGPLPESEMAEIQFLLEPPSLEQYTYPFLQPKLLDYAGQILKQKGNEP